MKTILLWTVCISVCLCTAHVVTSGGQRIHKRSAEISAPDPLVEEIVIDSWNGDNTNYDNVICQALGNQIINMTLQMQKQEVQIKQLLDVMSQNYLSPPPESSTVSLCGGIPAKKESHVTGSDSEYMIVAKELSWAEAAEYCEKQGFLLASLETKDEDLFIQHYLNDYLWGVKGFWLSGSDRDYHGCWRHLAPEMVLMSYTNWGPNEPRKRRQDQCLYLSSEYDFLWGSKCCQSSKAFICERPLVANDDTYTGTAGYMETTVAVEKAERLCGTKTTKKKSEDRKSYDSNNKWKSYRKSGY